MAFEFNYADPAPDPTADFLARERQAAGDILGGDDALFGSSTQANTHTITEFDFVDSQGAQDALGAHDPALDAAQPHETPDAVTDNFLGEEIAAPAPGAYTLDDPVDQFQSSYPPLEEEARAEPLEPAEPAPAPAPAPVPAPAPAPDAPRGPTLSSYNNPEEETEPQRAWRERQADEIARRDAQAERVRAETVSRAELDIDKFYTEYNAQKEKNIKRNKENEARFRDERTRELAEGTTWTRVTKLLDLQNSQSKTIAKGGAGATDLTRMKELYLALRREGETAPGASGY